MRILEPSSGILAFYDGREEGATLDGKDWVEYDLALGVASYAVVDGRAAIVHDTHTSPDRGEFVRTELERRGVDDITVVFSHWHLDHIAGAGAFDGCEIIATDLTAAHLISHRHSIETGTQLGPPPVNPVVMPTRTFARRHYLTVGSKPVELIHVAVHSDDAAVLWLPAERILLAGDTVEDTVTFVDDPGSLETHLAELDRLAGLAPARILPAHGDPETIAAGGYGPELIAATRRYIRRLLESREDEHLRDMALRDFIAEDLGAGTLIFHEPYETVHRENVRKVCEWSP